jgi:high-affinity nickel permease
MASFTGVALGLFSVLLFGLRHGVDYDHIAAITDITSANVTPRREMILGLLYALGHGFVVAVLGVLAVMFKEYLPEGVDRIMERFVGATLIILGVYVFVSLFSARDDSEVRIQSRLVLLANLVYRTFRILREKLTGEPRGARKLFENGYGPKSTFVIGMIHGVGAETPTQLGLFLFAAGVGGRLIGIAGVFIFVLGVLVTNTLMCAASVGLFRVSFQRRNIYRGIAGVTAVYSLVVGVLFLFGGADLLPPI